MKKRIFKNKMYRVERNTEIESKDWGIYNGDDVHAIIRGCKYDEYFGMYFNRSATIGWTITEV